MGPENASDSRPTTISTPVTNRPKLSASTTPKLDALWFHNRTVAIAAPARPMAPSGPIGIRSPGERNASATIAAMAAAVTHSIGTMAFRDVIGVRDSGWLGDSGWPGLGLRPGLGSAGTRMNADLPGESRIQIRVAPVSAPEPAPESD